LFGQDIVDFLKQIRDSANNTSWWRKQQESHEGASQERMDLGQKTMEVLEAFIEEQNKLKERFSPYLKFKVWKHWLFW
jgi:hypothetical protein